MKNLLKILTIFSAIQSLLPFLKPQDRSLKTLLWIPKLIAGAISPLHAMICGLGAFVGLLSKDWVWANVGLIGTGLAAKFIEDVPDSQSQFEAAFGSDWEKQIPEALAPHLMPRRFSLPAKTPAGFEFQQNIVIGQSPEKEKDGSLGIGEVRPVYGDVLRVKPAKHPHISPSPHEIPKTRQDLLADLWLPASKSRRSGLGLIYAHGSGWRVGDKDLGTRPFFQRLASHGHVIIDIAYTLWPRADIPKMVKEVNQAVVWMKKNASRHQINPEKIVLMGGSAGAHLVLLAAYAPEEIAFQPPGEKYDTTVCGVVAFYPPVDLLALHQPFAEYAQQSTPGLLEKAADGMIRTIFQLNDRMKRDDDAKSTHQDMFVEMLGGTPQEIPDTYKLLSPIYHVDYNCPPTLLLQGADDVFDLAAGVRDLHTKLQEANVPVVWVEFPHTEHAFDLLAPQISPVAQAASFDVERFLAMLV
jgi:acetyl esterase/lipase